MVLLVVLGRGLGFVAASLGRGLGAGTGGALLVTGGLLGGLLALGRVGGLARSVLLLLLLLAFVLGRHRLLGVNGCRAEEREGERV